MRSEKIPIFCIIMNAGSLGNRSVKSEMNRSSISFQMVRNTYTKIPC